jgi:hypothetical protein
VLLLPTYRHGTWATHLITTTDIVVVPDDIGSQVVGQTDCASGARGGASVEKTQ